MPLLPGKDPPAPIVALLPGWGARQVLTSLESHALAYQVHPPWALARRALVCPVAARPLTLQGVLGEPACVAEGYPAHQ